MGRNILGWGKSSKFKAMKMLAHWESSVWPCVPGAKGGNERCFMFHLHGQESEPELS